MAENSIHLVAVSYHQWRAYHPWTAESTNGKQHNHDIEADIPLEHEVQGL